MNLFDKIKPKMYGIVLTDKHNQIGKDNKLIYDIPEDLKEFKRLTKKSNLLMGKNTYESLPGLLPNRNHYVLTSKSIDNPEVIVVNSFDDYINNYFTKTTWVIGGASVYEEAFKNKLLDKFYLNIISKNDEFVEGSIKLSTKYLHKNYEWCLNERVINETYVQHIYYPKK